MSDTKAVKAKKVRPGDFLPGLDNGYVYDVEEEAYGDVTISFHDTDGGEARLTCHDDMLVTVKVPRTGPV